MKGTWIDTYSLVKKRRKILAKKFAGNTRFIELPGAVIRYKISGNGSRSIVFIPDAPNTIEHYDDLCNLLKDDFNVIILELPGFGFSIPTQKNFSFTLNEAVQIVIDFFDALSLKNCLVCFPCVAGFIAFEMAKTRPDLIDKIISVQTPSWEQEKQWAKRVDFKGLIGTPVIGQLLMQSFKKTVAKHWYKIALPKDKYDDKYLCICNHTLAQGAAYCLASAFQGFLGGSLYNGSEKIEQEVLIIWGEKDRTHRKTDKKTVQQYFKKCTSVLFENEGHFPELENPVMFAEQLKKYI
jgi:pimeloyl-ACP methyl ester carboxylesterase